MNIIAPAGDMDRMIAAIEGGANEVYLGLRGWGARRYATNFDVEELITAIDYAHLRGVKVLLTLNTIMKINELEALRYNLSRLYEHGLDAVIVQDLGVFRFLKENFPSWTYHCSTQMTIGNHYEANYLKSIGFKRAVLARELSFEEIKKIRENTEIELEIFVSGSLCISYSGNCYLSGFVGGRSGNRGMCAYTCRKKYKTEKGEEGYFLSPNDQFMEKAEIEKLKVIGIDAIKVEGRMKSEKYVFETASYYKALIEGADRESRTYKIFNRGYSKGFFYGANKNLMNFNYPSNYGFLVGKFSGREVTLENSLTLGDGVAYLDRDYNKLGGEYIRTLEVDGKWNERLEKGSKIIFRGTPKGSYYLFKTFDKELDEELKVEMRNSNRKLSLNCTFKGKFGEKLSLKIEGEGVCVEVFRDELFEKAKKIMPIENLKEKLSEIGNTTFSFKNIDIHMDEELFIPLSIIKDIKREGIEKFKIEYLNSFKRNDSKNYIFDFPKKTWKGKNEIVACVRTLEQKKVVEELGIKKVYMKQIDVAREGILDKVPLNSNLAGNLYQLLNGSEEKISLDWNLNIGNPLALLEIAKIPKVDIIYLTPEISKFNYPDFKDIGVKKGIVIYGQLQGMYIEHPIFNETKREIFNEEGDKLILYKNQFGNSELYWNEPMNLIPKLDEILEFDFDELRLDFNFESDEEIRNIVKSIPNRSGTYTPYNFERGIF